MSVDFWMMTVLYLIMTFFLLSVFIACEPSVRMLMKCALPNIMATSVIASVI